MDRTNNQLIAIQYLRGLAALMVVFHHARNPHDWLYNPISSYGAFAWGVDIFFVISGFIIFIAARNETPVDFAVKRVIRVVPLYWMATIFLLLLNEKRELLLISSEQIEQIVKSLLFVPQFNLTKPAQIWPYLIPGWTLNYEMFFYLIFAIGLIFRKPILVASLVICTLLVAGVTINFESALMQAYTDPILFEFLTGLLIGWIYKNKRLQFKRPEIVLLAFLMLFLIPVLNFEEYEIVLRIIASTSIVAGAILLGPKIPNIESLKLLGDASYSIYLTHAVVSLRFSKKIWRDLPLDGLPQFIGWIITALLVSIIVGVVVHLYIERPMLKFLRKLWDNIRKSTLDKGIQRA
ncbi:acyltransferase [Alteromonas mediterranea]|uniref:acyltransferase family protein n=1 Tax=Alteromonas mediterranea TaxID=314275 RepID=UPI001130D18C|nr:acyltransferase [Alteromonas mediterranea]QDG34558.1 acyltransferase [Alteromonas mediterranea]